jgi:hypothetical protein
MKKTQLAALLCVAIAATVGGGLVTAQTKTAAPAAAPTKPAPAPASTKAAPAAASTKPAPAPAPTTPAAPAKEGCPCKDCSKCEPHSGMGTGGMMDCPMKGEKGEAGCAMGEATSLADITVENMKSGASILFVAKDPANVQKVQQLARDFAAHINSPHHGGMHEHGHEHGH